MADLVHDSMCYDELLALIFVLFSIATMHGGTTDLGRTSANQLDGRGGRLRHCRRVDGRWLFTWSVGGRTGRGEATEITDYAVG